LQYNKDGQSHGSQLASLNFVAAYFEADVLRKVAILHLNDIKENTVLNVMHKKPNGIIIILPQVNVDHDSWESLQQFLCIFLYSKTLVKMRKISQFQYILHLRLKKSLIFTEICESNMKIP